MRVELFPADNGGCGNYRMIWPGQAINDQDLAEVVVRFADSQSAFLPGQLQQQDDGLTHVVGLGPRDWPDMVVLQRPLNRLLVELIPQLKKIGVCVVVELDDDFMHLDPHHAVYSQVQPRLSPDRNWRHLQSACMMADLVTVSTPYLARTYGYKGNAVVVPNYVPEWYLTVPVSTMDDGFRFVWSGTLSSHPNDLQVTMGAVERGLGEASFQVIGPGTGVRNALRLKREPIAHGFVPLEDYPKYVAEYDCMLVPLAPTPFNHAKSYLKGLEAAACGLEVIASPTEDYLRLEQLGLCRIAEKPKFWEAAMKQSRSITDRDGVAEMQRERIKKHGLTIEERANERYAAWKSALDSKVKK